jgi:hypothetical protein
MALRMACREAAVEPVAGRREHVDPRFGGGPGLGVAGRGAPPREDHAVALDHAVPGERRAVCQQRVEVEHRKPGRAEVRLDPREGCSELVLAQQIVERVVEAGDEVEAAEGAQPPEVGVHERRARRPAGGLGEHGGRDVAAGHAEAVREEGQEALARAAGEVEQRVAP